ncbi:MAG: DNA polymerase III subunit epsilon [Streptomyces sp.]|nr:DNA polymerase III subunit epsilon [Streptomyces sp.]
MKYLDSRRIGWDTETTSTDPTEARIITAAIVARGGDRAEREQTWVINPGVPIPPETTAIHGFDDARVQVEGQPAKAALDTIASTLAGCLRYGMPVTAFNTAYDWSVLHYELLRHGLLTMSERLDGRPPYALLDALVLDKQADKYRRGSRKLKAVAAHYGVHLDDWHEAKADAVAALGITDEVYRRNPRLNDYNPQRLYLAQQAWREEQQRGLQAHLRQTDETAYCAPEWPLVPAERGGES